MKKGRRAGQGGKENRRRWGGGGRKKRRKERMERREKGRERKEDNHLARTLEQWLSAYAALKRWQDIQSSFAGIRPSVLEAYRDGRRCSSAGATLPSKFPAGIQ